MLKGNLEFHAAGMYLFHQGPNLIPIPLCFTFGDIVNIRTPAPWLQAQADIPSHVVIKYVFKKKTFSLIFNPSLSKKERPI